MPKKLYRSRTLRMVSGVCGGIAEYFNVDETLIRLVTAFGIIASGIVPGVLLYFAASIIVPEAPKV
ncbi:MAG: PspC domain-containing protein [Bacillota bacterium]